jgi:hypothetical protein
VEFTSLWAVTTTLDALFGRLLELHWIQLDDAVMRIGAMPCVGEVSDHLLQDFAKPGDEVFGSPQAATSSDEDEEDQFYPIVRVFHKMPRKQEEKHQET